MNQPHLSKTPREALRYDIDCSRKLGVGDEISSVSEVRVEPVTTPGLTVASLGINSTDVTLVNPVTGGTYLASAKKVVSLSASAGVAYPGGQTRDYKIRLTLVTLLGYQVEVVVPLKVGEFAG